MLHVALPESDYTTVGPPLAGRLSSSRRGRVKTEFHMALESNSANIVWNKQKRTYMRRGVSRLEVIMICIDLYPPCQCGEGDREHDRFYKYRYYNFELLDK